MSNGFKLLLAGAAGAAAATAVAITFNTFSAQQNDGQDISDLTCRLGIAQNNDNERTPYIADIDVQQIVPIIEQGDIMQLRLINMRRDSFRDLEDGDAKAIYEASIARFKTEIANRSDDNYSSYMQSASTLLSLVADTVSSADSDQAAQDLKDILELSEDAPNVYSNYYPEEYVMFYYAQYFEDIAEDYADKMKELSEGNPVYFPTAASIFAQFDSTKDIAIDLIEGYLESARPDDQQLALETMGRLEYRNPGTFVDFDATMAEFSRSSDTFVSNEAKRMAFLVNQARQEEQPTLTVVCE